MDDQPQSSETDFLYTLASNGRFERIADYVASNEPVAVRYGAAGILTEFADDLEAAATTDLRKQLIDAVLEEPDDRVRARVVETLLYIDESILHTLVAKIAADSEPTPTDSPHPLLLVEWLGSEAVELRLLAVAGLGDVGTPSMIPKLSAACNDTDRRVRERALRELGRIGNPRCVEEVADCLDSDIATIRHEAAKTLGKINTRGSVDRLRPATRRDDDDELRRIAFDQLGSFPSSDVINTLTDGLRDDEPDIRQAAASSLMEMVAEAGFEESHTIREEVAESIEDIDDDIVPDFVILFSDTYRTTIRRNTAWLLGRIGDSREEVVDQLLDSLSDDDFTTAQVAASSLARIGGRDIEKLLEEFIEDQPEGSRSETRAEFVLNQITDSEADAILKDTVEYIHVSEPEDYTDQKQAEAESSGLPMESADDTAEAADDDPASDADGAESVADKPESATAETESG